MVAVRTPNAVGVKLTLKVVLALAAKVWVMPAVFIVNPALLVPFLNANNSLRVTRRCSAL